MPDDTKDATSSSSSSSPISASPPGWRKISSNSRPTSSSRPPPTDLPDELLSWILQDQKRAVLRACLRVNKAWNHVAATLLFTFLQLPSTLWPTCVFRPSPPTRGPLQSAKMKKKKKPKSNAERDEFLKLLDYVRVVDIHAHPPATCASADIPALAEAKIVRVWLSEGVGSRRFHPADGQLQCKALNKLRPHTLVVRRAPLVYGKIPPLFPPSVVSGVTHYVTVAKPDTVQPTSATGMNVVPGAGIYGLVDRMPSSTDRLTIIFDTPDPDARWIPHPPLYFPSGPSDTYTRVELVAYPIKDEQLQREASHFASSFVGRMVRQLAMWSYKLRGVREAEADEARKKGDEVRERPPLKIKLVNFQCLVPLERGQQRYTNSVAQLVKCVLRDTVCAAAKEEGEEVVFGVVGEEKEGTNEEEEPEVAEEVQVVLDNIELVSMVEYIDSDEWKGVLQREELHQWGRKALGTGLWGSASAIEE